MPTDDERLLIGEARRAYERLARIADILDEAPSKHIPDELWWRLRILAVPETGKG